MVEEYRRLTRPLLFKAALVLALVIIPAGIEALSPPDTRVKNLEIASVASGGAQGDGGSFFVTTSEDGRFVTFMSLAKNLAPEPPGNVVNYTDVYLRDRLADKTYKVSKATDGGLTNEASLDPTISLDGRYVAYFSFASNLIYGDTNGQDWSRSGLDVFVWDRLNGRNSRVSLDERGKQINGNSIGTISPDGQYILFVSDGRIFADDWNSNQPSALYLRNWHTGAIERISVAMGGGFPNQGPGLATISLDNRYVVFDSWASNLAPGDKNEEVDVFLYDRLTKTTTLVSRDANGRSANGRSVQSEISLDGKSITFLSTANNLVPGDTNNQTDIFVYDVETADISRVSKAENGAQANGSSKEPSVCGNGRFISYTTEATNLFANDDNNQRDVIVYDRTNGTNSVATVNWKGELGNSKAHRSYMVPDCRSVAFASDASNLVANDKNISRDIFVGDIGLPADFSSSLVSAPATVQPGDVITYRFSFKNAGYESATAILVSDIPTNTTYLAGSASPGVVYHAGENRIEWQNVIDGTSSQSISFSVVVEQSLVDATAITCESLLSGDGKSRVLTARTVVNGYPTYFPMTPNW